MPNLQNQPESVRKAFIPDEGKVFVYRDYSQAEARIVAYLSRCTKLIELFEDPSRDVHTENAARIFSKPIHDVLFNERYLAKRTVHAANYGMGAGRFVEVINKDYETTGVKLIEAEARKLLDKYFYMYPEIQSNFWREVERELRSSLTLTGIFGHVRTFYGRWSDKFLREGYSFKPQNAVGWLCRRASADVAEMFEEEPGWGAEWLLNVHDSILIQCWEQHAYAVAGEMKSAMAIEMTIQGKTFTIPTDCKIGFNWGDRSDTNPRGLEKMKGL